MSSASMLDNPVQMKIVKALENPNYVWRTLSGIEQETLLPRGEILATLEDMPKDVLVISHNKNGSRIFSTRSHYRKTESFLGKLVSVLSGEVK